MWWRGCPRCWRGATPSSLLRITLASSSPPSTLTPRARHPSTSAAEESIRSQTLDGDSGANLVLTLPLYIPLKSEPKRSYWLCEMSTLDIDNYFGSGHCVSKFHSVLNDEVWLSSLDNIRCSVPLTI